MWDLGLIEQVGFARRNLDPLYVLCKGSIENQLCEGSHQQSNTESPLGGQCGKTGESVSHIATECSTIIVQWEY